MNLTDKTLIVITGPTASGKSALAIDIATHLNTEIISADSRQIFKGIPIITAQPDLEQLSTVKHHLIAELPLSAYYSASMFETDALKIAESIWQKSDYVVVCGGSMMYIDALCNGIDDIPTVPENIRQSLKDAHASHGDDWLRNELLSLDPIHYRKVDLKNIKRVFHAVEICMTADKPYSSLIGKEKTPRPFKIIKTAIDMPRPLLFERINHRVEVMLESGALEEARRVYEYRNYNSLNTVGFKELFDYLAGTKTLPQTIASIQKNTRVYAKKQLTWFRRDNDMHWIDATAGNMLQQLLKLLRMYLNLTRINN